MSTYIFAYGSLMNPASLRKTLSGERVSMPATLKGYERICNVVSGDYAFLNIRKNPISEIRGVIFPVTDAELGILDERESGYERFVVTNEVEPRAEGVVYVYIHPGAVEFSAKVPESYLRTCSELLPKEERVLWRKSTVILSGVIDDTSAPVYPNHSPTALFLQ